MTSPADGPADGASDGASDGAGTVRFGDWTAPIVRTEEYVDPARVAALAALFDSGLATPVTGDPLPAMWHWVALPTWPASSTIGTDGHPRRGTLLPPLPQPRRMFAGGELVEHSPILLGETLRREAVVTSVQQKRGRSGDFALVNVAHTFHSEQGELRLVEQQNLVFRDPAPPVDNTPADPAAPAAVLPAGPPLARAPHGFDVRTDPTLLMRFSALTANPHRIHYDWPYATRTEGYPGLVVHGPLSTLLLAEALRLAGSERPVRLRHRNLAPLFCAESAVIELDTAQPTPTAQSTPAAPTGPGRQAVLRRADTDLVTLHTSYQPI